MGVNTGINSSLLRPQTFHVLTYLKAGRSLTPIPQRLCLIGIQAATATATAAAVIAIDDPTQTEALFGRGSIMDLMAKKAFATAGQLGSGPALFACPLAETTTARVETFTVSGTATIDGDIVIRINGRYIRAGIASGTTAANSIASVLKEVQKQYGDLHYTAADSGGGVLTLTATVKSTLPNGDFYDVVSMPTGLTGVFAQSVAGVGVLDMQTALDAVAGQDFDGIAVCNHLAADITEINAQLATTWAPAEKKPRWFFIGENGSIGTATGLACNHEGIVLTSWEQSRSTCYEIATAVAVGALSKNRPNANYDGMTLPLYPPPISYDYTSAEIETALNAGLTPMKSVVDPGSKTVVEGVGTIVRLITTRTTLASVPFVLLRDFGISRTAWFMARQYDIAFAAKFGSFANPDGVLLTEDTENQLRDMVLNLNYAAQDEQILKNVDTDKARLVIEEDPAASGRVNIDVAYTIVVGLHQAAFIHRAQL